MRVDGHEDIASNALVLQRDFTQSVQQTRARESDEPRLGIGICALALPELLQAEVGVVFGTLFTMPAQRDGLLSHSWKSGYHTAQEAHDQAWAQLQYYRQLTERDEVSLIGTRADLQRVEEHWQKQEPVLGIVPLIENADAIRTPDEVVWWYEQGVRLVGPAWQQTRYCGGTHYPGPLTPDGVVLLREMETVGMVLDTSHLAEQSFWQALEQFGGTVIASHSNCRVYVDDHIADRHLSDAMIKALLERDAVIGVVLCNGFLKRDSDGKAPGAKERVTLDDVYRHIDHICQLAGHAQGAAIGSDIDGGFGREEMPHELDSVADLPRIAELLLRKGYRDTDVEAIMGQNWLRILKQTLP